MPENKPLEKKRATIKLTHLLWVVVVALVSLSGTDTINYIIEAPKNVVAYFWREEQPVMMEMPAPSEKTDSSIVSFEHRALRNEKVAIADWAISAFLRIIRTLAPFVLIFFAYKKYKHVEINLGFLRIKGE